MKKDAYLANMRRARRRWRAEVERAERLGKATVAIQFQLPPAYGLRLIETRTKRLRAALTENPMNLSS